MIWLQTATVFWRDGGTISLSCSMYMGLVMLGRLESPAIDKIPAEFIKGLGRTIRSEIHKHSTCLWNKEECPSSGSGQSVYLSIRRAIKQIAVITETYHFCQLRTKFYPTSFCQG